MHHHKNRVAKLMAHRPKAAVALELEMALIINPINTIYIYIKPRIFKHYFAILFINFIANLSPILLNIFKHLFYIKLIIRNIRSIPYKQIQILLISIEFNTRFFISNILFVYYKYKQLQISSNITPIQ